MKRKSVLKVTQIVSLTISIIFLLIAIVLLRHLIVSDNYSSTSAPPVEVEHRILYICSYNPLYFTYQPQIHGIDRSLFSRGIEYDVIYMDAKNYGTQKDISVFYDFIKSRISNKHYEAILLGDDNALLFAMQYQEELFSGIPMVFFGINDLVIAEKASQNPYITGFYEKDYMQPLLELSLRLFPSSQKLIALHDSSVAGTADRDIFMSFKVLYPDYDFIEIDSSKMTKEELIYTLENLPKDSLFFYMTCYSDIEENNYSMLARTNTIVNHVHVPIFRNYAGGEGKGILGSVYMDFEEQCYMAGLTIANILTGDDIS